MLKNKIFILCTIFYVACGRIYDNADVYIKTVSGHEYSCKNCTIYLDESLHWDEDEISIIKYIDNYYVSEEFEIYKSKISEIRIKLNRKNE